MHRETLWKILAKYGFPPKVINIIKNLNEGLECCIKLDNGNSDWFDVETGVRQDCTLSPMLFGIAMDFVMKEAKIEDGLEVDGTIIEELAFADDFATLSLSSIRQQKKITATGKVGLRFNGGKTVKMKIGGGQNSTPITLMNTQEIIEVEKFVYLGSKITNNGSKSDFLFLFTFSIYLYV